MASIVFEVVVEVEAEIEAEDELYARKHNRPLEGVVWDAVMSELFEEVEKGTRTMSAAVIAKGNTMNGEYIWRKAKDLIDEGVR